MRKIVNITLLMALCLGTGTQIANAAATAAEIDPEIVASTWDDDTDRFACVTINGKELLRLKENQSSDSAVEEKAEAIAAKLDQLVRNKKFSADKLYPVQTKDGIVLKVDGNEVLKLSANDLNPGKSLEGKPVELGLKVANTIRIAFGAKALPVSFLKLAENTARQSLNNLTAIAKASGHFSGTASWYGPHFHGHKTSDGTIYDQEGLTAAHRSLPFGTKLLVMNRRTGDTCVVKVNDRGPFIDGRIIDLSKGAARQLNMLGSGVAMVDCIVLGRESSVH